MKPLASIIILTLNEEQNLPRCLKAVFSQKTDFDYEVLVVDSGSRDRTHEIALGFARNHHLRIIEVGPEQFSHGRTRQFASEQAEGDYLVYLVADAAPADNLWLSNLVKCAAEDDNIAGAYSRQLPWPDSSLVEKIRLSRRAAAGSAARESRITSPETYWMMPPLERILFCDFDDVSSVRKRTALKKIPIPDCPWAEDLVWSKECLLAGYKIVFAAQSAVFHSHRLSSRYLFRRGWVDQKAASQHFGQIYYPDFTDARRGFFLGLKNEFKEIFSADAGLGQKLRAAAGAPAFFASEIAGRFLAGVNNDSEAGIKLIDELAHAKIEPENAKERVAKTGFAVGDKWRKVILANPPAAVNYKIEIKSGSALSFAAGIKPEAFKFRKAPIDFLVEADRERIFKARLELNLENLRSWSEFSIDLEKWAGKKIRLSLITDSQDMNHGWAGWAEPRIVFKNQNPGFELKKFLASRVEQTIGSKRFRHN